MRGSEHAVRGFLLVCYFSISWLFLFRELLPVSLRLSRYRIYTSTCMYACISTSYFPQRNVIQRTAVFSAATALSRSAVDAAAPRPFAALVGRHVGREEAAAVVSVTLEPLRH